MINDKIPGNINLAYKEPDGAEVLENNNLSKKYAEVGPSSLYGRRGDNITFHTQGSYVHGYWNRMWHWVWKDLGTAFCGLFRIFFSRND